MKVANAHGIDLAGRVKTAEVESVADEEMSENAGGEEDAMMAMDGGNLEDLISLDMLAGVSNVGGNTLNESRLCKGLMFSETQFLFNRHSSQNFYTLLYDPSSRSLFSAPIVVDWREFHSREIPWRIPPSPSGTVLEALFVCGSCSRAPAGR